MNNNNASEYNDPFLSDEEFYRLLALDGVEIVGPIIKRIEICSEPSVKDQSIALRIAKILMEAKY